ncbi:hypothetical protein EYZ11_002118 [Aspergillus tanneri]|uniref:Uncharacterized protein n=1 Tax=Aspergillus tanneri TaxID=1220188 RepID=A0A4S3JRI8_9EURO|nr:hypothetical protein EYZ11_002118 [Aspergillus tanneri]
MHHLSTENILLKLRCQGLEQALQNEKRKRKRGKPLALEQPAPETGGAVFYSPNKIQQARGLQAAKEREIQLAKASKEEAKLRRQQEKEAKQQLLEERKRIRAFNKELRLQQAEEKKRQKEEARLAKDASIQLQNDFKTARRGKTKIPTPPAAQNNEDIVAQVPRVVDEASLPTNSRGRVIRLPHRFRDD